MKKSKILCSFVLAFIMLAACSVMATLSYAATDSVLYVKSGGNGDGMSPSGPMGDLGTAIETLAETGGKIVICGNYDITSSWCMTENTDGVKQNFSEPAHTGKITISGRHEGVDYKAKVTFGSDNKYLLSGPTTLEYMTFDGTNSFMVGARFNPLTIGHGIDISAFRSGGYIVGGYNNKDAAAIDATTGRNYGGIEERDVQINVGSGTWLYLVGLNRYLNHTDSKIEYKNYIEINLYGSATIEKLVAGAYESSMNNGGNAVINLTDDAVVMNAYSDAKRLEEGGLESMIINLRSKECSMMAAAFGAGVAKRELYYHTDCDIYPDDENADVKFTKKEATTTFATEMPEFEEKETITPPSSKPSNKPSGGTKDPVVNTPSNVTDAASSSDTEKAPEPMDTGLIIVFAAVGVAVAFVAVTVVVIIKRRQS